MNYDVFMAGFGGQGILLIGNLLAYAAILEGKNASFFPAYGPEKRGGSATCTVIVADGEIGSPVVGCPGNALLLNQMAMDKYFTAVKPGGRVLINTSLMEDRGYSRQDLEILPMPANKLAMDVGDVRLVNMIMLGAFVEMSGIVRPATLKEALDGILPERNKKFIPANMQALDCGAAFAQKVDQHAVRRSGTP
ncbi:MAG: 2-oxoacid:acceptor oxidoreductase family protein [Syntrophotaleaceae bacterium]